MMIQVKIHSLALDEKNQFPVVILQTLDGAKQLPIWIGPAEWNAIQAEVMGKRFQRPLTHDLLVSIVQGLSARVLRVEIVDLVDNTFFARVYLETANGTVVVDARPSDSLAIALKCKAKIYVAPKLFTSEIDILTRAEPNENAPEPTEEERSKLLRQQIEQLNLRDFGRFSF